MQSITLEQLRATANAGEVVGVTLKAEGSGFYMEISTLNGQDAIHPGQGPEHRTAPFRLSQFGTARIA